MFKIRKSFAVVFSFLLCTLSFGVASSALETKSVGGNGAEVMGSIPSDDMECDSENMEPTSESSVGSCSEKTDLTPEDVVDSFIHGCVYSHLGKFVPHVSGRDDLTKKLDEKLHERHMDMSLFDRRKGYHDAVQEILEKSGEVKYGSRVLSAWVWYELCSKEPRVDCKELLIRFHNADGSPAGHVAVLIHYNSDRASAVNDPWYVCDLSFVSEFRNFDLAFIKLEDYVRRYNKPISIIVSSDEYIGPDPGQRLRTGQDILLWLANERRDLISAANVLKAFQTPKIIVTTSPGTVADDRATLNELAYLKEDTFNSLRGKAIVFVG